MITASPLCNGMNINNHKYSHFIEYMGGGYEGTDFIVGLTVSLNSLLQFAFILPLRCLKGGP